MKHGHLKRRSTHFDRRFLLGSLLLTSAILYLSGAAVQALNSNEPASTQVTSGKANTHPGEPWGVRVVGVRTTAAGYMLEFRYRVTDAEKAQRL